MATSARALGAATRRRVAGVLLLAMIVAFAGLTYAFFTKTFTDTVPVTVQTSRVGLQLPTAADVKVRGLIVGEVSGVAADGDGAEVSLALDPDLVDDIPTDVTALIVPKTLFGEKYVSLEVPDGTVVGSTLDPDQALQAGDVIGRTDVPIEVEQVLADVYPLLTAVRPTQLSYTLNAMATALSGRGDRIGDNLERLDSYLTRLNPRVPQLVRDLDKLGHVSDVYADVMPQLGRLLRNGVTTGQTVLAKEQDISNLLTDVTGFADTTRGFLDDTGDDIVRLGEVSTPITALLAQYSPEFPCMTEGLVNWIPRMSEAYRDHTLHINLELLPNQPTGYTAADDPEYGADIGPACHELPLPPHSQDNPAPAIPQEVVRDSGMTGYHGKYRTAPSGPPSAPTSGGSSERPTYLLSGQFGGTRAERQLLASLAGPVLGVAPDDVPGVTSLLLGPLTRGTEVSVR